MKKYFYVCCGRKILLIKKYVSSSDQKIVFFGLELADFGYDGGNIRPGLIREFGCAW